MKKKPFDLIIISGRRWFQRSYGNTYHSVYVEIRRKGKEPVFLQSGQRYGYGDHYRQTAAELLTEAGYVTDWHEFYTMTRDHREKFVFTVQDVSREKEL